MLHIEGFTDWNNVLASFGADESLYSSSKVVPLIAVYEQNAYDGSAFVIFWENKSLYLVSGSHCSCYGLDGQWDPEQVTPQQLMHIATHGTGIISGDKTIIKRLSEIITTENLTNDEFIFLLRLKY